MEEDLLSDDGEGEQVTKEGSPGEFEDKVQRLSLLLLSVSSQVQSVGAAS